MFRISRSPREPVSDVGHLGQVEPAIRSSPPGRYHADKLSADLLASGHTSRRCGIDIERKYVAVVLRPDPETES